MPTAAQQIENSGVPIPQVPASSFDGYLQANNDNASLKSIQADIDRKDKQLEEKLEPIAKDITDLKPPELTTPPAPQAQPTDAWETFGSPASWLMVFGSLLTREPLQNALNGAAGVINARKAGNDAEAQRQMDIWKVNSDNAIKLANFEMDTYNAAIAKDKTLADVYTSTFKNNTLAQLKMAGLQENYMKTMQDNLTKLAAAKEKIEGKNEGDITQAEDLRTDLGDLQKRLDDDPGLVGTKGLMRRGFQSVVGQTDAEKAQDLASEKFKADLVGLQSQIGRVVLNTRYFSKSAQQQANDLLPGLTAFDDPGKVRASLQTLDKILKERITEKGGTPAAQTEGAPAVGTVQDGYKFKGGDPADPANWEKAP